MPRGPSLGGTIRKLRLKVHITLRELARRVDVSPAHLSDIEHGRRMPSDDLLRRIAAEFADVGATYESLRILKPQLEDDLEKWVAESSVVRELLREAKNSPRSAREMLDRLREDARREANREG